MKYQMSFKKSSAWFLIVLLSTIALIATACGGSAAPAANPAGTSANAAPSGKPAPNATGAPQAQNTNNKVDCTAVVKANEDFGIALAPMVNLTANTDYSAFTDPSSPFYMDFAKVRGELTTLATLPDPTDAVELTFGKPSASVAYFRQLVDIAESDVKAQGKPFKDTNSSGQKILGIDSPWLKEISPFGLAMSKACQGFTMPADTPASNQSLNQPTNQVGQTATLGDLHVTVDKVTAVPGELGNLPDAGNRFVFLSVTIENAGKTNLATNSVATATLNDAAGKPYYFAANAIMLGASRPINGEVAPGEKTSGNIGYQLPTNAGDLIWIVEDNAQHRAVFAVKASEIVEEGAPIGESTAAAMQTGAAATTAALIEMGNNADATDAAVTVTADSPEPTDVPFPTDIPEPTETPSP